ncbi:lipid IV(A) 3-deoxy-D-manno-octulosonic acid transferase [Marinimicrobium sp. ARAG 43.8]|uniref:lipid IV(A) 3-deoxy-D-manno-octulosonic acid transferase n=1 Tax=Marinimicrobium sp. ARAG 43.8 TaxID=3418719 RepID=UPI003CF43C10
MRWLYSLMWYALLPLLLLRLRWLARANAGWGQRWKERFGAVEPPGTEGRTLIWLHTASVGEVLAAAPLVRALRQDESLMLLLTTTTPTGADRVVSLFGDSVAHCYMPFDLPGSVARFLARVQPRVLLLMETELWPNVVAACHRREIPTILINGRLSARSARRYQRFAGLSRAMLQRLSEAGIQSRDDAERFQRLGLRPEATHITGNIKFDLTLDDSARQRAAMLRRTWVGESERKVCIAASTHRGEDEVILEAWDKVREQMADRPLLVLVPRHPERFAAVGDLVKVRGLRMARRSSQETVTGATDVVLGDVMGEMLTMYGASDLAFVGGSLVPNGGHNLIEPAAWGLPLLSGPHLFNFSEVAALLGEAGALKVVEDSGSLAEAVLELLGIEALREIRGQAAREVAEANRGALEKTLHLIRRYC